MVSKAFSDLSGASQPLLDDLALAEREQGKTAAEERARERAELTAPAIEETASPDPCEHVLLLGVERDDWPQVQDGFCVRDSYYYSQLADPPATRAFRLALAAVGGYTELLLLLAEGRNIDEARAQLQVLANTVSAALAAVGAGGALPLASTALEGLRPLLDLAAKDANAKELERLVRQESPRVEAVLEALRDGAPAMFRTLTESSFARYNTVGLSDVEVARAEAQRIEGYRVAVSNYAVLLDQYRALLDDLVTLYERTPAAPTLADLTERSAQLSARADAWRRALASLRTGIR